MTTDVFCYLSGIAGNDLRSERGPTQLINTLKTSHTFANKINSCISLRANKKYTGIDALPEITRLNQELAELSANASRNNQHFLTISGDHSSAIGTWSGAAAALQPEEQLGLIWIDAHMDSHTFETSPSANIHGMPLAALLGHGDRQLTSIMCSTPKLQPENVALIGIRSYEAGEKDLLDSLGVKIYYMPEVHQRGLQAIFTEATNAISANVKALGVSIDIDAICPLQAPGVSTPAQDGLNAQELLAALPIISQHPKLIGAEVSEFLPHNDIENKTEKITLNIIKTLLK